MLYFGSKSLTEFTQMIFRKFDLGGATNYSVTNHKINFQRIKDQVCKKAEQIFAKKCSEGKGWL